MFAKECWSDSLCGLQLDEGDVRRLANLARLTSMLIASKALPISVVKASLCLFPAAC